VAKRGVERGKQKRKAAREQASSSSRTSSLSSQSSRPLQPATAGKESQHKVSPASSVETSSSTSVALVSKRSSVSSHSLSLSPTAREPNDPPTSPPEIDPHPRLHVLPQDRIFNFFFTFYILPVRDPLARRGFLENLAPIYHNANQNSSLMLSTMAVASSMFSIRMCQNPNTTHSRSYYLGAVKAMRDQVAEQKECAGDEVLIAVLLLQLYEVSKLVLDQALWANHHVVIGWTTKYEGQFLPHTPEWCPCACETSRGCDFYRETVPRNLAIYPKPCGMLTHKPVTQPELMFPD
jgi:hypothetical protein